MPPVVDFRTRSYDVRSLAESGQDVGAKVYRRLYAIENLFRVVIHSVLTAQIGSNWWTTAADPRIRGAVAKVQSDYANSPGQVPPGGHELYYTFLRDLAEIMRANSNLFAPVIPDIDVWIARLEQIRLPRNVVGHMNWSFPVDRQRVDALYRQSRSLSRHLEAAGVQMVIP